MKGFINFFFKQKKIWKKPNIFLDFTGQNKLRLLRTQNMRLGLPICKCKISLASDFQERIQRGGGGDFSCCLFFFLC